MSGPPESLPTPSPGQTIAHYAIVERLGRGGMGEVFVAEDKRLDRKVALKILSPEIVADQERLQRFQREAKALAALNHPSIVTIYSVEEVDNLHFLTMELVEGKTLRQIIDKDGLQLSVFFDISIPLAEALSAAHERGVTHRDLKPENIMVTESGRLKVLDFGLAKVSSPRVAPDIEEEGVTKSLTQFGVIVGTVPYMSPEQAQGKSVDHRSDIFSLGIIMYEMITGQRPFTGETVADVLSSILRDTPTSVSQLRTGIPRHLARIIRQCLEKDPKERFQSALDVHNQLKDLKKELEIERVLSGSKRRAAPPTSAVGVPLASLLRRMAQSTIWLSLLLVTVFALNYVETAAETALKNRFGTGQELAGELASAAHWFERGFSFERQDVTNPIGIYGYSISYFFLLPALALLTILALVRRPEVAPYRVFTFSIAITYAISLPFFLFFPIPERWAFPDSDAILLSDMWSSKLIEAVRPFSGLDNCFPSFHVASTVVIILICYRYCVGLRTAALALGLTIIFSTYALGIHWLIDIIAGLSVGTIGVAIALRLDRRLA